MTTNSRLIEFVVSGDISDVNAELDRRGISSIDILSLQYMPKSNLAIGNNNASYRVITRAA